MTNSIPPRSTLMKECTMRPTRAVAAILLSLSAVFPAWGQVQAGAPFDPSARLTLDPLVKTGVLDNGVRYFVRANAFPLKRAELRLVVNAGSVLEEANQVGLAHFIEHMA